MEPAKKISPAIAAIIVIVLIGAAVAAAIAVNNNNNATQTETSQPTPSAQDTPQDTTSQLPNSSNASYANGTYTAVGSYSTPGGRESIELTVQIVNDTVSATSLKQNAITGEAMEYQEKFASGYKDFVVGKSVNDVSLSRVAGSSLTSAGFNTALEQIKTDAAA